MQSNHVRQACLRPGLWIVSCQGVTTWAKTLRSGYCKSKGILTDFNTQAPKCDRALITIERTNLEYGECRCLLFIWRDVVESSEHPVIRIDWWQDIVLSSSFVRLLFYLSSISLQLLFSLFSLFSLFNLFSLSSVFLELFSKTLHTILSCLLTPLKLSFHFSPYLSLFTPLLRTPRRIHNAKAS